MGWYRLPLDLANLLGPAGLDCTGRCLLAAPACGAVLQPGGSQDTGLDGTGHYPRPELVLAGSKTVGSADTGQDSAGHWRLELVRVGMKTADSAVAGHSLGLGPSPVDPQPTVDWDYTGPDAQPTLARSRSAAARFLARSPLRTDSTRLAGHYTGPDDNVCRSVRVGSNPVAGPIVLPIFLPVSSPILGSTGTVH